MRERSGKPTVIENLGIGLTLRTDRRAGRVARAEQRRGPFDLAGRRRQTGEGVEAHSYAVRFAELARKGEALREQGRRLDTVSELDHRRSERAGGGADL